MSKKSVPQAVRVPSYRLHKASKQGFAEFNGRRIYLGRYDKSETRIKYNQLINEWLSNGQRLPIHPGMCTVAELCNVYRKEAEQRYRRPDGTLTSSITSTISAVRTLRELYCHTLVKDFGPNALRAIREVWIQKQYKRNTVNSYVGEVKRIFKYGVSVEMVPESVYRALTAVDGLREGRSQAKESDRVIPVSEKHIEIVKGRVSRQVRALIDLQLLTGARGGELLKLKPIDIDTSGAVWTAELLEHKTSHKGKKRMLYFGPKAQGVLREFLTDRAVTDYFFSPKEAIAERAAMAPTHRRSNQKPNLRKTERRVGDFYTPSTYRNAIRKACRDAGIDEWTPHRLRHNAGTMLRKKFGIDTAATILGHARLDTTEIYAELDTEKAINVIGSIG